MSLALVMILHLCTWDYPRGATVCPKGTANGHTMGVCIREIEL